MRILVTGATGFIGRSLVPHLIARGNTATTLLIREFYSGSPLPPPLDAMQAQFDVVYADLRNFQLTLKAIVEAKPDCVIHLAAAGATDPFLSVETALRHNLTGTVNLLRACFEKSFAVRQCIIARTPGELRATNVYSASKAAAWKFCQMYARTQQWPIYGAMIFQAYGPGQADHTLIAAALAAARAGEDLAMTAGRQERDWIYVTDVVAGLVAMSNADLSPGTTIDLGTGHLTSVADVVRRIYSLVNQGGRPLIGVLPDRPGEEQQQVADALRSDSLINWQATISLDEGLVRLIKN